MKGEVECEQGRGRGGILGLASRARRANIGTMVVLAGTDDGEGKGLEATLPRAARAAECARGGPSGCLESRPSK